MCLYVYLSSNDALFGQTNPSSFTVGLNTNSFYNQRVEISLASISFYWTEYPINSKNNTLIFRENSGTTDLTATISEGSYTTTEMVNALKSALESAGANTYTITYNTITKKITISAGSDTIRITGGTILNYLGLTTSSSFATSITGANNINLAGTSYIDVVTDLGINSYRSGTYRGNVLARVPIDVSYGSLLIHTKDDDDGMDITGTQLNQIKIDLLDDQGQEIILSSNSVVSIVLKLHNLNE